MKRIFTLMVIALVAISTVFAGAGNGVNTGNSGEVSTNTATMELKLNFEKADLAGYKIGFVLKDNLDEAADIGTAGLDYTTGIPTSLLKTYTIAAKPDRSTGLITDKNVYIFYRINTSLPSVELTLTGTVLNGGDAGNIAYDIQIAGGNKAISTTGSKVTLTPSEGFIGGTKEVTITTNTAVNASMATKPFTGELTLKIGTIA